jgi:hypothetical protein
MDAQRFDSPWVKDGSPLAGAVDAPVLAELSLLSPVADWVG